MKNKLILTALTESLILESYKDVKNRFINDGADKTEVESLLNLHKKLKDMNRLPKDLVNIDLLTKGKSFDDLKSLMSKYSEKDTETKTDIFNKLESNKLAENNEWVVYYVDTAEKAYLFHGKVKWCISSGTKKDAEFYFTKYSNGDDRSVFCAIVRKNPIGDEYDYIMDQYISKQSLSGKGSLYWDANDDMFRKLPAKLNVPSYKHPRWKFIVPQDWILNSDGTYTVNTNLYIKTSMLSGNPIKLNFKFKEVFGEMTAYGLYLESLEGFPEIIHGPCTIADNNLKSFKGGPKIVEGSFSCRKNMFTSFDGDLAEVQSLDCSENSFKTLKGCPKITGVKPELWANDNELTSLEGFPEFNGDSFDVINLSNNKLTNMDGFDPSIKVKQLVMNNNKLENFKGFPEEVDYLSISNNKHIGDNMEDFPRKINAYCNISDTNLDVDDVSLICDINDKYISK